MIIETIAHLHFDIIVQEINDPCCDYLIDTYGGECLKNYDEGRFIMQNHTKLRIRTIHLVTLLRFDRGRIQIDT